MKQSPLTKILSFLRAKPMIGGLEISDTALRFVVWDGQTFVMTGLRLTPGIVVAGQIKDRPHFVEALKILHEQIFKGKKNRAKISSVISLSSIGIYTQIFTLPFIEGSGLEKAVELNIQMISPLDFSETYSGWQFATKDRDKVRLEILSAFANKGVVDEFVSALQEGGFLVVAVESRALSLTRLLKDVGSGFDPVKTLILMSVDSSGLDFLIIRHGQLHFDYFTSWRDIQGIDKEISPEIFRGAVVRSLHQVLNYYNSHWQEPLDEIILTTTGFREEVAKIIQENFSIKIKDFELNTNQSIAADWYVSLGCELRGLIPRRKDREISLLGVDAREEFGREQVLGFLRFWQVLMPSAVAIFLIAFLSVSFSLSKINDNLALSLISSNQGAQAKEMKGLESQIEEFNRNVSLLSGVEDSTILQTPVLQKLINISSASGINISRVYYQSSASPISISGSAKSPDELLAFKKMLEGEKILKDINLPPAGVKVSPQGVDFSMTFSEVQTNSR